MALTVETGSGSASSESYASTSDVDTYQSNRGVTLWATLSTAEKEQALRRATTYMEQVYRLRWKGWRYTRDQALSWPRESVERLDYGLGDYYETDAVPVEVVNACCEMAFKAAFGDLSPDIGRVTKREKVDVIEVEYEGGRAPFVRYRAIDNILAPLLKGDAGGDSFVRMVRA